LQERTREREPLDWAQTETNLGLALVAIGERESGTARLERAIAAERAALEELTRERNPLGWAETEYDLGRALAALGERENRTDWLEEAIAAYRAALEEQTRERVPPEWARTQFYMGVAIAGISARAHNSDQLKESLTCIEQAKPVFEAAGMVQRLDEANRMIGRLREELATGYPNTNGPSKPPG